MSKYKKIIINVDNDMDLSLSFGNDIPDKECIRLMIDNLNSIKYEQINSIRIIRW